MIRVFKVNFNYMKILTAVCIHSLQSPTFRNGCHNINSLLYCPFSILRANQAFILFIALLPSVLRYVLHAQLFLRLQLVPYRVHILSVGIEVQTWQTCMSYSFTHSLVHSLTQSHQLHYIRHYIRECELEFESESSLGSRFRMWIGIWKWVFVRFSVPNVNWNLKVSLREVLGSESVTVPTLLLILLRLIDKLFHSSLS